MKNILRAAAAALLAVTLLFFLGGCAGGKAGTLFSEPLPDTTTMREVYSENGVTVEAGELHTAPCVSGGDAGQLCLLRLRLTNGGGRSIAVSSMLCLDVSSGGEKCAVLSPLDTSLPAFEGVERVVPFDGLARTGQTREGYVAFRSPNEGTAFDIRMALDYAADEWIEFTF